MGTGERPKLYVVRRLMVDQTYTYMGKHRQWVKDRIDAMSWPREEALANKDWARLECSDPEVIYHAIVPCQ